MVLQNFRLIPQEISEIRNIAILRRQLQVHSIRFLVIDACLTFKLVVDLSTDCQVLCNQINIQSISIGCV